MRAKLKMILKNVRQIRLAQVLLATAIIVALVVAGGLSCILALALSSAIILSGSDRAMFGRFAKAITRHS